MSAAERTARLQAEGGQGRDAWWGPYGAVDGLLRPTITGGAAQELAPGWQEALSLPQLGQGPFVCHPNRVGSDWPAPGTAPPLVLLTPLFPKSCQPCWVPPRGGTRTAPHGVPGCGTLGGSSGLAGPAPGWHQKPSGSPGTCHLRMPRSVLASSPAGSLSAAPALPTEFHGDSQGSRQL